MLRLPSPPPPPPPAARLLVRGGLGHRVVGQDLREWTLLVTIAEELPSLASPEVAARAAGGLVTGPWRSGRREAAAASVPAAAGGRRAAAQLPS